MAALVGGAAVGAVFGELLKAVLDIKDRADMFKPTLVYLQSHLIAIAPVIKEIEQHNNDLGRPKEELESLIRQMEEGTKLVLNCLKIRRLNYMARARYQKQLEALVDSLVRFFIIDMQAQTARDQKETLIKVRRILSAVNKWPQVNRDETSGASSSDSLVPVSGEGSESESYYSTVVPLDEVNTSEIDSVQEQSTDVTDSVEEQIRHVTDSVEEEIKNVTRSYSWPMTTVVGDENGAQSTATHQLAENAVGTDSAEVGQSKANAEHNPGKEHLMSEKSSEQSLTVKKRFWGIRIPKISRFSRQVKKESPELPTVVHCKACGTFIRQNDDIFYTEGYDPYCNQCYNEQGHQKLISHSFNIEDLLRASAEVLGKGTYGSTYKATLEDGRTVAVKRLREVIVGKSEFEKQVETVQTKLSEHPNVISLRSCFYDKDEKLLLYDYKEGDSLSKLLHGPWETRTSLDWDSRTTILHGAATGIAHIHSVSGMNFVHGNIKSSNVLVTKDFQVYISDFGSSPLVSVSKDGYQAPEVFRTGKLTQKCDVFSFGVILCEILTGESPVRNSWFTSLKVVQRFGKWTDEVFDIDPVDPVKREEMLQMVRLAMTCVETEPRQRPSMIEVVKRIEEISSRIADGRVNISETDSVEEEEQIRHVKDSVEEQSRHVTDSVEEQISNVTRSYSWSMTKVVGDQDGAQSTATQPAENGVGTDSAEVGQSKTNEEHNQGKEHLMSEKSSEQILAVEKTLLGIHIFGREVKKEIPELPLLVHCKACGTFIKQNDAIFYIESYPYCNQCHNEQLDPKGIVSYTFDIEDLLRGSAEVLGKGSYGTTYKATLNNGRPVAVKRLRKEVMVGKSEFEKQVENVQTMLSEHPNVISLRACYHDKGEKLLICLLGGRSQPFRDLAWNARKHTDSTRF